MQRRPVQQAQALGRQVHALGGRIVGQDDASGGNDNGQGGLLKDLAGRVGARRWTTTTGSRGMPEPR